MINISKKELELAIETSKTKKEASEKLKISLRSLYNLIDKYKKPEIIQKNTNQNKEINHFVISDMQVSVGTDTSYYNAISNEIIERKPDVIVFLGDFWDMKSMYKATKETFNGKLYKLDIAVGIQAMEILMRPILNKINKSWNPRLVFCLGNHEYRITKMENSYKALNGLLSIEDLKLKDWGFEVIKFLEPIVIDDIAYCHYFTNGLMNNPIISAKLMIMRKLMNCVQGHRQSFEIHREVRADGYPIYGIFAGSSYLHDEDYLGNQGNHYARLVWALNDVKGKSFDPEQLLINRLVKKWNKVK